MQRNRRLSRPLLAVLAVVIVLGGFAYLHNVRRSRASDNHAAQLAADSRITGTKPAADFVSPPQTQPTTVPARTAESIEAPLVTVTPSLVSKDSPRPFTSAKAPANDLGSASSAVSHDVPPAPSPTTRPSFVVLSGTPLADAKAKSDAGDLLGARDVLNAALLSGRLSSTDADAARTSLIELNQTIIFSPRKFADDPWGGVYAVQNGERLSSIAAKHSITWQLLSRINGIDPRRLRAGSTIKLAKGPFHAVVNKSQFRMDLYMGSPGQPDAMFVTSVPVGLGKDDSTPTGAWHVMSGNKVLHPRYYSPRGEGVMEADDPKNPLGGYWIGLEGTEGQAVGKNSYGIHGTIDPDSIGKQASMGCIRLRHEDIALVFDLLVESKSRVIITP